MLTLSRNVDECKPLGSGSDVDVDASRALPFHFDDFDKNKQGLTVCS